MIFNGAPALSSRTILRRRKRVGQPTEAAGRPGRTANRSRWSGSPRHGRPARDGRHRAGGHRFSGSGQLQRVGLGLRPAQRGGGHGVLRCGRGVLPHQRPDALPRPGPALQRPHLVPGDLPVPAGDNTALQAVTTVTSANNWAVGSDATHSLIEHQNNSSSWSLVPRPRTSRSTASSRRSRPRPRTTSGPWAIPGPAPSSRASSR